MCENNQANAKKRVLSCIQPSGLLTLGNYLGALKNWAAMQSEFDCFFAVADLHAITVRQEPAKLRSQIYSTYAMLLALGIDPEKNTVFIQSQVPEHTTTAFMGVAEPASTPMIFATAAAALAPPGTHLFTALPSSTTLLA